jgi:hypothetical protein
MKTSRWLMLSAAILITVLEAWIFTGASASAPQIDVPKTVVAAASGDTP